MLQDFDNMLPRQSGAVAHARLAATLAPANDDRQPLDLSIYPTVDEHRDPRRFAARPFLAPQPSRPGSLGATVARWRARDAETAGRRAKPAEPRPERPYGARRVEVASWLILALIVSGVVRAWWAGVL